MIYNILFDESGNQKSYTRDNPSEHADLGTWYSAPEGFIPESTQCKLVAGNAVLMSESEKKAFLDPKELIAARIKKIKKLKQEGSRRIQTFGGKFYDDKRWFQKSQNFQDIKNNYIRDYIVSGQTPPQSVIDKFNNAKDIIDRKDRYVNRINEKETAVNAMTIEQVNGMDITDDSHWTGCD